MTKAYSYLRFSTPEQMKGDSHRRQTSLAVEFCKRNNLTLDTETTYEDLGISAFRGKNSEAGRLGEFLEGVRSGLIPRGSYLLVESLDRVSRQAARQAIKILENICDEGISVVTLSDNKVYTAESLTNDPVSLIVAILTFIRSNEESKMKSERVREAWGSKRARAAAAGHVLTTRGPHWLKLNEKREWELVPEKVDIVRRIFCMAADGVGTEGIAKRLNAEGTPVPEKGSKWYPPYIGLLLHNKAVLGFHTPSVIEHVEGKRKRVKQEPIPNYYPAIISEDLWNTVQAVRASRNPINGRSPVAINIFGGLAVCGLCGSAMNMVHKKARYLVCSSGRYGTGCKYASVHYKQLEERFLLDAEAVLSLKPTKDGGLEERLKFVSSSISAVNEARQTASDGYIRTRDEVLLSRLQELKAELAQLRAEEQSLIERLEATSGPLVARRVDNLKAALRNLPLDRQATNGLIRSLFTGISLNPDTGVATLAWAHGGESKFIFALPVEMRPDRRERNRRNLGIGTDRAAVKGPRGRWMPRQKA